jgi:hypothetical protein
MSLEESRPSKSRVARVTASAVAAISIVAACGSSAKTGPTMPRYNGNIESYLAYEYDNHLARDCTGTGNLKKNGKVRQEPFTTDDYSNSDPNFTPNYGNVIVTNPISIKVGGDNDHGAAPTWYVAKNQSGDLEFINQVAFETTNFACRDFATAQSAIGSIAIR